MNSSRASLICLVLILAFSIVQPVTPRALASAENQGDQAVAVAKNWVAQIDAGNYDGSYTVACDEMREKVPQDRWVLILKTLRTPWGPVLSRQQLRHDYKPNGVPGLEGECMVITYDTSFKHLDNATEVVVLKWVGGKWRGAGYTAGPKPTEDGGNLPPEPTATETHTEPHMRPIPQE